MKPPAIIQPLTEEDLDAVGEFLHAQFHGKWTPAQWQILFRGGWDRQAPDMGRVAKVDQQVVGVIGALYSTMAIDGHLESFCNIHSWMVLESYRTLSLPLLMSLIQDASRHYTNITANQKAYQSSRFVKFMILETGFHVVPNLPSPTSFLLRGFQVLKHPQAVRALLSSQEREVYDNLSRFQGLHQWALLHKGLCLHVVFQKTTWKQWSCAQILHAQPLPLFQDWFPRLATHLFFARIAFSLFDKRMIENKKIGWMSTYEYQTPRIFLSRSLLPKQISNIYTDRMLLDQMIEETN